MGMVVSRPGVARLLTAGPDDAARRLYLAGLLPQLVLVAAEILRTSGSIVNVIVERAFADDLHLGDVERVIWEVHQLNQAGPF